MLSCKSCGTTDRYQDGHCKLCAKTRAKKRRNVNLEHCKNKSNEWKEKNREQARVSGRKGGRTSWAAGEHGKAEAIRGFVKECACCESSDPRHKSGWNADHNHETGKFRAFICHPCNIAISHVEKFNLDRGIQIKRYLETYK